MTEEQKALARYRLEKPEYFRNPKTHFSAAADWNYQGLETCASIEGSDPYSGYFSRPGSIRWWGSRNGS